MCVRRGRFDLGFVLDLDLLSFQELAQSVHRDQVEEALLMYNVNSVAMHGDKKTRKEFLKTLQGSSGKKVSASGNTAEQFLARFGKGI